MEIILQERVSNLGRIGDIVTVKAGYARNFLIPYGKAMMATKENKAAVEAKRADLEAKEAKVLAEAQLRADRLAEVAHLSITVRASDEGKLYGSVGAAEIVAALAEKGVEIAKKEVLLKESLRELGDHEVSIRFHIDLVAPLPLSLVPEEREGHDAHEIEYMNDDAAAEADNYDDVLDA